MSLALLPTLPATSGARSLVPSIRVLSLTLPHLPSWSPSSQSTSKLPTPSVDGMDTLSDYIPQSNEISRVPSTAGDPTPAPAAGPSALGQDNGGADDDNDEVADDDESEYDSEGDKVMKTGTGEKKVSQKKEAKRKLDDKVRSSSPCRALERLS